MDEQPTMNCPQCRKEYEDFDGVGVVYCEPPEGCGFCRHLALTGGACDFCKQPAAQADELARLKGAYDADRAMSATDAVRLEFLLATQ